MPIAISSRTAVAVATAVALALVGCSRGSEQAAGSGPSADGTGTCPEVVAEADSAVAQALDVNAAWTGPTTGPTAAADKTIIFVAQTLTNPGVAGAAKGIEEAAGVIGWDVRVIDGQGDPAGIAAAMGQAITLNPDGIVIGGFDPASVSAEVDQAVAANIPLIAGTRWPSLARASGRSCSPTSPPGSTRSR